MKLLIDVPEEVYEALKGIAEDATSLDPYSLADIIVNKSQPYEERPQGEWEEDWQEDLDFMSRKGWRCPFCKWRTTYGESNFCMNCGADLRKGDET